MFSWPLLWLGFGMLKRLRGDTTQPWVSAFDLVTVLTVIAVLPALPAPFSWLTVSSRPVAALYVTSVIILAALARHLNRRESAARIAAASAHDAELKEDAQRRHAEAMKRQAEEFERLSRQMTNHTDGLLKAIEGGKTDTDPVVRDYRDKIAATHEATISLGSIFTMSGWPPRTKEGVLLWPDEEPPGAWATVISATEPEKKP
jgi:hypothetical protein